MPNYLLQRLTSSQFSMLHTLQNKKNAQERKKEGKEKKIDTMAHKFWNRFSFILQLQGIELQRERGIHLSSFLFPLGFGRFKVYWFILITRLRWSEVKDGSLWFFSCFIT